MHDIFSWSLAKDASNTTKNDPARQFKIEAKSVNAYSNRKKMLADISKVLAIIFKMCPWQIKKYRIHSFAGWLNQPMCMWNIRDQIHM